jgi:hypothetical protein
MLGYPRTLHAIYICYSPNFLVRHDVRNDGYEIQLNYTYRVPAIMVLFARKFVFLSAAGQNLLFTFSIHRGQAQCDGR